MSSLNIWVLVFSAGILYSVAVVVYRLYFHPLAKFPGPKLAAATGWYETYHELKGPGGQFMYQLDKLHEEYGPVVRLSPHEVHIRDVAWVDTLLASPAQGIRDKYTPAAVQAGSGKGVFGTSAHNTHRRRRAALNPLFSKSCATNAEGLIYDKIGLVLQRMDAHIARDGYVDTQMIYTAFTSDVVYEYCFGKPFGLLDDETKMEEWHDCLAALKVTIPYARQFNWIMTLSQQMPIAVMRAVSPRLARVGAMYQDMDVQAQQAIQEHEQVGKNGQALPFQRNPREKFAVFRTLLQNDGLPPHEKIYDRISHEGVTVLAAGGETGSATLMMATYFILSDKGDILARLREEVGPLMSNGVSRPSVAELERLPWLTAVVKEALRISTVTARLTRVAPDEALRFGDWVMPAGTAVSMTPREISFNPELFPSPREFRPERWLPSNPNLDRCNRYFVAFSKGSRMCLGLNLAWAELYIAIATIFCCRDFELYDTVRERDVDFTRDCFVGGNSVDAKGVRVRYAKSS
ncbi:cytochrome P450 [Nemania sp. NC0429]|nr:cytochrome P450 [Nemania sp. NC0429]